jgi:hypothetical protein
VSDDLYALDSLLERPRDKVLDHNKRQLVGICLEHGKLGYVFRFVVRSDGPADPPAIRQELQGNMGGDLCAQKER